MGNSIASAQSLWDSVISSIISALYAFKAALGSVLGPIVMYPVLGVPSWSVFVAALVVAVALFFLFWLVHALIWVILRSAARGFYEFVTDTVPDFVRGNQLIIVVMTVWDAVYANFFIAVLQSVAHLISQVALTLANVLVFPMSWASKHLSTINSRLSTWLYEGQIVYERDRIERYRQRLVQKLQRRRNRQQRRKMREEIMTSEDIPEENIKSSFERIEPSIDS